MIDYKVAFIISMFDEYDIVLKTLLAINKNYKEPTIIIVRSDDGEQKNEWQTIKLLTTRTITLPNLAKKYHRYVYPSYAVARNFSAGFSLVNRKVDYIVALLGDTLIYDPKPLHMKAKKMIKSGKYLSCCKAYGAYFNSKESTPKKLITGRFQDFDTTDFSAVLFVVDGQKFEKTKWFTNIKVTNDFTSEQCLGDETLKHFSKKEILSKTIILNSDNQYSCYDFTDGITYHAVSGKPGR